MNKKTFVAFLWHMHQPLYKDFLTGKYHLPWVRLHSTYSYLDMATAVDDFPDIKVTFNLTPSLLWQLADLSSEDTPPDIYLDLSKKDATLLTDKDKCFILKNFFSYDFNRSSSPLSKYKELFSRRGSALREEELIRKVRDFNTKDFRDLQVLFNLAWCGFTLKRKDPLVRELLSKGFNYTESEKLTLLNRQKEVMSSIIPLYRRLLDEDRIEISTSPFYHPVLPLLCRGKRKEGFGFQEDAKAQISKAVSFHEGVFGTKPTGMWPSEGSVSQEIIPYLVDEGIKWMATDEGVLLESFKGKNVSREELIYQSFTAEEKGRKIDVIFRDINLSNAISFRYSNMPAWKAAMDLVKDIERIGRDTESRIVSIILDGENPWPYYADGGRKFLYGVYNKLSKSKDIETVTVSEYLENCKERKKIAELYPGSWIDHNFNKWMGSPQKNMAWQYLEKAREDLLNSGSLSKEALEELYIAEGSDWFWWYDDFGTELNFVFDELFRRHLVNIYTLIKKEPPDYLVEPIPPGTFDQKISLQETPKEMARSLKVFMVSSEVFPFAKTGGLADVTGSLPRALASFGCDVRIIMPFYRCVKDGGFNVTEEASNIKHPLLGEKAEFNLYSTKEGGITTYFLESKKYFDRDGLYGTSKGDYSDNGLRFASFSKGALAAIKAIDFKPDVIHCNDWQSALIPFYLKFKLSSDSFYSDIKTLFTIHNMVYQGVFSRRLMRRVGIPKSFFNTNNLEFYGKLNFMKSGILYSDALSTVSSRYAEEITTGEYGAGLEGLLRTRKNALYGISNGADYSVWSPKNDKFIKVNFDDSTFDKKMECKKDLLKDTHLQLPPEAPLIGAVTRLADQKGMDLLSSIMEKIVKLGAGVIILGRGTDDYNKLFLSLVKKFPHNVYVCNDFNDELAHKIEAGCDMFIMPSRYEPCGLNQMYSLKYGTIPIVRATGGLDDVIVDVDKDPEHGNGFKFVPATSEAFYGAIERAIDLYRDRDSWKKLIKRAMTSDFSWTRSAEKYLKLYRKIVSL